MVSAVTLTYRKFRFMIFIIWKISKDFTTSSVDLKNDYPEITGFSVRNMQCMMQFFDKYNQELTMVKGTTPTITQSMIAPLEGYNFALPIKHLGWTHNLILMQQVKDIHARYWYMVQSIASHWKQAIYKKPSGLITTASTVHWRTISRKPVCTRD